MLFLQSIQQAIDDTPVDATQTMVLLVQPVKFVHFLRTDYDEEAAIQRALQDSAAEQALRDQVQNISGVIEHLGDSEEDRDLQQALALSKLDGTYYRTIFVLSSHNLLLPQGNLNKLMGVV